MLTSCHRRQPLPFLFDFQISAMVPRFLSSVAAALLLAGAGLPPAARALPEAEVGAKLDTILLLMAVDDNGQPRAVNTTVDGRAVKAYLAAISIAGAEEITAGKLYGLSKPVASGLRFAPVSLARFNQLLAPLLQKNPNDLGVIAPDPAQRAAAEQMLIAQQVPAAQAKQIATLQPMVFCPEPGLLVSSNDGPDKGRQFVPCATEADFVQSIVDRAKTESPQLAKSNPRVVAIPLNAFITYLRQEPADKVGQLRVVPSGRMVSLIQQLNQSQQSTKPSKPAGNLPTKTPEQTPTQTPASR